MVTVVNFDVILFAEHLAAVRKRGAEAFEIRNPSDLVQPLDGLILPGGESTVMKKMLHDLNFSKDEIHSFTA